MLGLPSLELEVQQGDLSNILSPARRQVNAQGLHREVHAAEEGLEAGLASLPAPLNFQRRELFLRLLLQDKEPAQEIAG